MPDQRIEFMRTTKLMMLLFVGAALVLSAIGVLLGDTFYLRLGTEALIFAGLALSVDLLLGYTGVLSLGQAVYFGIGAYASALVLLRTSSFWLAMAAAGTVSLVASIVGGLIVNRVRGVYFTLVTLGLAQIVAKIVYNTPGLGASDGIIGVPVVSIGIGPLSVSSDGAAGFFLVVLGFVVLLYGLMSYLLDTPFGRVFIALKANERRVPFLGYSVWRARMTAYVLAGVIAGLSGAFYPMLRGFVSPELMSFMVSGNAVISVLLGGAGTLVGAIYGSVLISFVRSVVGSWTEHHQIIVGLLFIVAVLFLPRGLLGALQALPRRRPASPEVADAIGASASASEVKS
jgi:branched-chain amino acid transport system permease protein